MEDALNDEVNTSVMPVPLKSVEVNVSEEPKIDSDKEDSKTIVKVNGDTKVDNSDGTESSDYDNLIIDERQHNRKRKQLSFSPESGFKGFKRFKNEEEGYEPPMNPYFNESLFELSELHNNKNIHSLEKSANSEDKSISSSIVASTQVDEVGTNSSTITTPNQIKKLFGKKKKVGSPKLREYAQYLGLQPTVQFKCSRCALRGFSSLALLNEHQLECTGEGPISPPTSSQTTAPSTNFRVTRKVYLCSACGTYYENWNLFLHMREIHKRFICLYCLGMFSHPEKLSLHLVTKHNCVPSQLNSEEDFFHVYKEPCFLMCCECEKVFSERDNFFGHTCGVKNNKNGTDNKSKINASTNGNHRQLVNQKNSKNSKQKSKTFVEHVTGDTAIVESNANEMNQENQEKISIEPEEVKKQEEEEGEVEEEEEEELNMQVLEKEETGDSEEKEKLQDQVSKDSEVIETNDENQEGFEVSKDENTDLDCDVKNRDSESEADDVLESPRYESESSVNLEDSKEVSFEELAEENDCTRSESDQGDTRKVPKVTLKLPKNTTPYVDHADSDDSDKLMMEVDHHVDEEGGVNANDEKENKDPLVNVELALDVAGSEIPIIELELEHPLDKFDIQMLLQKCLKETIPTCVYCNHARKIAVNGKQLGLHAIAEHRFSAIVNSITAEELIPESFVMRIKESLPELQNVYFNLEASTNEEGMTFSHIFECFQCRYATSIHKELYLHNRKMHAKTILLCIMCKSNFYSYSELICHLCPGLYELNNDVNFRCCMCVCDDLPSAFRLMVHLRKRHHACDVCLELCHNQSRLSNHVWKHKLHHLCYRCGIAYRNKPDITKHLFWKHGTESVLCKKCLQKKWPHVYHFCIPPSTFTCEECNLNFTKAVALKVHKRIHRDEKPHACTFENCNEKFISKKLLLKHEFKHREPQEDKEKDDKSKIQDTQEACAENGDEKPDDLVKDENSNESVEKKPKPRVDVYDLPELNLSESDSSDSEEEAPKVTEDVPKLDKTEEPIKTAENESQERANDDLVVVNNEPSTETSVPVLENIWDDFKLYQASKEKEKHENIGKSEGDTTESSELPSTTTVNDVEEKPEIKQEEIIDIIMRDHDYSLLSQEYKTEPQKQQSSEGTSMDHDYCTSNSKTEVNEVNVSIDVAAFQLPRSPEKKQVKPSSSSDSSNDSDSSSCTCGSNCSCSGSSDSSSSSSDSSDSDSSSSEGRRKQQARRERRRRAKGKKESEPSPIDVVASDNQVPVQIEQHIEETDLDTTETETDEDFYDKQPQKLASKLIAEKRKELMLLAGIGTLANGAVLESSRPSTPSLPETETQKVKKKSKNKKKKKKRKQEKQTPSMDIPSTSYQYQHQLPIVSPITISLTKNSPMASPNHTPQNDSAASTLENQVLYSSNTEAMNMSDSSLRASKRRRIPNRFYGYSSDEEGEKPPQPPVLKWRKADLPSPARPTPNSPLVVPPITIKTLPPPSPSHEETTPNRTTNLNEMRVQQLGGYTPLGAFQHTPRVQEDSGSESNESSSEEEQPQPPPLLNKPPNQPPLYCYCRCPYDEVSEMIGCDADDCLIEWFHFECVGIMVPPKGQWFCPDCRKKKQQRKELALT